MDMGTGSCCPRKAVLSAKCTEMVPHPMPRAWST